MENITYNLSSLFTEVGHPERQDIQQGAGIAPGPRTPGMDHETCKDTVYNLADLFKVVEAAIEEAGVEETDEAAAGGTVTPAEEVVEQ